MIDITRKGGDMTSQIIDILEGYAKNLHVRAEKFDQYVVALKKAQESDEALTDEQKQELAKGLNWLAGIEEQCLDFPKQAADALRLAIRVVVKPPSPPEI